MLLKLGQSDPDRHLSVEEDLQIYLSNLMLKMSAKEPVLLLQWRPDGQSKMLLKGTVQPCVEDFADMDVDPMEVDAHRATGPAIADYLSKPQGGRVAHLLRREGAVADLNMLAVAETCRTNEISQPITTFVSSNPGPERRTLVPTYDTDAEELEDQPVSPIRIVAMGMDYNAESDNEFNQPIYEEVQTGLKHKQSDHDDDGYVTLSKVEDFNDGYEDHELQFCMGPAKDSCVKMTNDEKKVKVEKDTDQELGQASSMTTRGKASKHHCQKNLPSVLMEDRVWSKIIMPALLVWAGSLADPWMILDDKLMQLLQTIIMATFPDFPNLDEIHPGMPMFTIVSQQLCQWRSNFGSTAITVISHFLVSDLNSAVPSPPEVWLKCSKLLDKLVFLYSDQETLNPKTIF
ncbi:hypothetical protein EDC04DRAFT_2907173 [Pisolithus marmoratus]|nr:hypothetical protein EDC04DRAFT_2907173 [Pisolithus marmoratus]